MAEIIKAPGYLKDGFSVFLSGSCLPERTENWRVYIERLLSDMDIIIYDPYRDDWDDSWIQDINNPKFREQVEWELMAMERATIIVIHFEPEMLSPITLLEFGLFAQSGKLVIHCPNGFWRKGNVDIVCAYYDIPQVQKIEELADYIMSKATLNSSCFSTDEASGGSETSPPCRGKGSGGESGKGGFGSSMPPVQPGSSASRRG